MSKPDEDDEPWCDNSKPVEEEVTVVQADYIPDRWGGDDD